MKDFGSFWDKYCKHVKEHKYPFMLISSAENIDNVYPYPDIRFMRTTHNRSDKTASLSSLREDT